jgi:hypothetical protein
MNRFTSPFDVEKDVRPVRHSRRYTLVPQPSVNKPVRAIKEAMVGFTRDPLTGQITEVLNTRKLIRAVSLERKIPRHSSVDTMLAGLAKPALERILARMSR